MLNDYVLTCHRPAGSAGRAAACPPQPLVRGRAPGWQPLPWGANARPACASLLPEREVRGGAVVAHLCCGWGHTGAGSHLWGHLATKQPSNLAAMRFVQLVLARILSVEAAE